MIEAELVLEGGLLRSCRIRGHAGAGPVGGDIVCAAVSVLSRTAFCVLSGQRGIGVQGERERGEFFMEIDCGGDSGSRDFLDGVGTFLTEGLLSVSREFPDFCKVTVVKQV